MEAKVRDLMTPGAIGVDYHQSIGEAARTMRAPPIRGPTSPGPGTASAGPPSASPGCPTARPEPR
jgi:hypothetical protein